MLLPTPIIVTFPVVVERDGWVQTGFGEVWDTYEVTHELRAEVTFGGPHLEPSVTPLEPSHWTDSLGPEVQLGKVNEEWIGAREQAAETAFQELQKRFRESA